MHAMQNVVHMPKIWQAFGFTDCL